MRPPASDVNVRATESPNVLHGTMDSWLTSSLDPATRHTASCATNPFSPVLETIEWKFECREEGVADGNSRASKTGCPTIPLERRTPKFRPLFVARVLGLATR